MEFPKDFRFDSEFDLFCKVVDTAERLISSKSLFLLFGFEEETSFFRNYTNEQYDLCGFPVSREDFEHILGHEIVYLINDWVKRYNLEKERTELETYLVRQKVSNEDVNAIVANYLKKKEYANAHLLSEDRIRRFEFKKFTTSKKVLEFDWDICRYIFEDDRTQPYVQIKFSILDDLPNLKTKPTEKPERFQFVCDRHDVDYLIEELKRIRTRLEEDAL